MAKKHIFKFINSISNSENLECEPGLLGALAKGINTVQNTSEGTVGGTKAPVAIPDAGNVINVTKDYKWTKTLRDSALGRQGTPTILLEEFYVVRPAFYTNLNLFVDQIKLGAQLGTDIASGFLPVGAQGSPTIGKIQDALNKVEEKQQQAMKAANKLFGASPDQNPQSYLKAYEDLYGIKRTGFEYKLPYLEDKAKTITNRWSEDKAGVSFFQNLPILGDVVTTFQNLFRAAVPGVGIDYAKGFSYGGDTPSYNIKFYLDNTKDSQFENNLQQNVQFILLLLYQNLPNKLNRLAFTPPVIYRAKLPGVFFFKYSYLSNIDVKFLGVRREKKVFLKLAKSEKEEDLVPMIVPEGYEITLTLKSLLPESRNLMYGAFDNKVTTAVHTSPTPAIPSIGTVGRQGMGRIKSPTPTGTPGRTSTTP